MTSEFSSFLVKIQIPNSSTPSLFEQGIYQYSNPQIIKENLSHLFEQIMNIAHNITDKDQLRTEVVQIQMLMTGLIHEYQYQTASKAILQKLIKFLEALQEEFPNEFNHLAAYPHFAYSFIEPELKTRQHTILLLLRESNVNSELLAILKHYFDNIAGRHRLQPSWNNIQYLHQLMDEIEAIYENTDRKLKSVEIELLRVFVRNNFNKKTVIIYWHNRIEELFGESEYDQEACINHLLLVCNSSVYGNMAYDKNAASFHEQLRTILNARKKFIDDEYERILKTAEWSSGVPPVQINAPGEIIGLLFRSLRDVNFFKLPYTQKEFFEYLVKVIRGPKGNIFKSGTLLKGSTIENVDHVDRLVAYLKQMINQLEERKDKFLRK